MIKILPFNHVKAFCDINTKEIFISDKYLQELDQLIKHELVHILSNDTNHGNKFTKLCNILQIKKCGTHFDNFKQRIGIPNNIAGNIGNVTGIQNLLLDYHLLQSYRKFSQRILGTEGQWEFSVEAGTIRLFPIPKGSFPVIVRYLPSVGAFKSPWARELTYRVALARMKESLGYARRKISSIPGPDGSAISYDGDALVQEGREEYKQCVEDAILHGEPLSIYLW